jgi:hypothetical protein
MNEKKIEATGPRKSGYDPESNGDNDVAFNILLGKMLRKKRPVESPKKSGDPDQSG